MAKRMAPDPVMIDDPNMAPDVIGSVASEPPIPPEASMVAPGPVATDPALAGPMAGESARQMEVLSRKVIEIEQVLQEVLPQIIQMLAAHEQVLQEIMNVAMAASGAMPMNGPTPPGPPPGGPMPGGPMPGGPMPPGF